MAGTTRGIEQTPVTIDTKVATTRQTPKIDFGSKVLEGANTVASTVSMAAPLVPGGAIISAAVSGISTLGGAAGGGSPAYGVGGWNNSTTNAPSTSTTPTSPSTTGTGDSTGSNTFGVPGSSVDLKSFMNNNMDMLKLQMFMQNENQRFSTWSNVLRVRHDTTKNAINNIR